MFHHDWSDEARPAFAGARNFGPGGYEGWQPWARHEHEERSHRRRGAERPGWGGGAGWPRGLWDLPLGPLMGPAIAHFARRFPFGPGMGPGPGGFGPRMFGRGDLKYALLELLSDRPKHGYEMIKDLEDRSGGFYTPSAGAIYPTLQLLEDRGWVTADAAEGKRVYKITEDGRAALVEHRARREPFGGPPPWGQPGQHGHGRHFGEQWGELRSLRHESMEVARLMRAAVMASEGRPERLEQLRAIVGRARNDLNGFLGQGGSAEPDPRGGQSPTGRPDAPGPGPIEQF